MSERVLIVGGGAAGFFTAITIAESNPDLQVTILEKTSKILQKVRVSGGGRCNVTHACFDPSELAENYPRGSRELLGPFHRFMTGDTMAWFESRDVPLKIESDGRVFPISNSSESIIECLVAGAEQAGVQLELKQGVKNIEPKDSHFEVQTDRDLLKADYLVICTGSNLKMWEHLASLGHTMVPPVPSLFTFKIKDSILEELPGVSVKNARVRIEDFNFESSGPVLITHWGLSGPAVLKLSAFAARALAAMNYQYIVYVNWLSLTHHEVLDRLNEFKNDHRKQLVAVKSAFDEIPKRLWNKLVSAVVSDRQTTWSMLSKKQVNALTDQLVKTTFHAQGKSTFKEEFVTAGGVDLKEINFKNFESRLYKNLFFAGEILNIDAVTGGFNFQNAWTGAYLAGNYIADQAT